MRANTCVCVYDEGDNVYLLNWCMCVMCFFCDLKLHLGAVPEAAGLFLWKGFESSQIIEQRR